MSVLRDIAGQTQFTESVFDAAQPTQQVAQANPARYGLLFSSVAANPCQVTTNPSLLTGLVQSGIRLQSGQQILITVRDVGSLAQAAWFLLQEPGGGVMTVYEITFPKE